ncbi:hypothetical protein DFH09DRAFT_1277138 [Mycena vulgaris]|nr:hypothetical protein DFH09DRAFT_1277138 [Mycena vulgaris]
MKRLLHRISSHNVTKARSHSSHSDHDHDPPPLPTLSRGAENGVADPTSTPDEMHRGMTMPVHPVSSSGFSNETAFPKVNGQPTDANADEQNQPATMMATVTVTSMTTEEKIWRGVNNPNGNVSKSERILNKIGDGAGTAVSASTGIVATIKTIAANEEVQEFGKAILNGIPALMSALEGLSKVHPFAAAAFLPFQFAYKQEMKRHDNERSRISLFESIKDVMLVAVEMRGVGITPDDTRRTPDGQPVVTRLAALGEQMRKDIKQCYNGGRIILMQSGMRWNSPWALYLSALDAMQKQSLIVRFCKASTWNDKLAGFKVTFKTRREELHFALTLNTAASIQDMSTMQVDKKVGSALQFQSTYAAGPGANKYRPGGAQDPGKAEHNAELAALRKEYRSDVASVIEENMESFAKRLDLSLDLLSEDLKNDIHREGDRMIKFLKGGPHLRLRDKIMRQVWKDQGWRGSAKTRTLVLALRDYLVERAEHAESDLPPPSPASPSAPDDEDAQDPETAMGVPLPESWMLQYLQVKRLRNLQRKIKFHRYCEVLLIGDLEVLDPDTSGFSTIAEVNAFTQSRQRGWSLPRWVSYWAIGWQIYATRYCTEIDDIFTEMLLIREKVGINIAGNKRYLNSYISETWPFVVGLKSAIERFEGTDWLADQFKEYIDAQESAFKSRLDKIHSDIDSSDTVHEILRGEPIEREFYDDSYTVKFVVEAAWLRYNDLVEFYKHQEIVDMKQNFDWFSCGLVERRLLFSSFRNYFEWKDWTNDQYYKTNQIISYSAISEISEMKPEELKGILIHETKQVMSIPTSDAPPTAIASGGNVLKAQDTLPPPSAPVLAIKTESSQLDEILTGEQRTSEILSEIRDSLSGVWFGFHATEWGRPYTGMFYLKITASLQSGQTVLTIEGEGSNWNRSQSIPTYLLGIGTLKGTATVTATSDAQIKVDFTQKFDSEDCSYRGVFMPDLQILSGGCESIESDGYKGHFFVKKTPTDSIMCYRPLLPRRLDAQELWSFATNAVIGEMRRRKPSLAYVFKRMKMIRRCLELLHDSDAPGEALELSSLRNAFTVQEYLEIRLLAGWYTRVSDLQPMLYCDSCTEVITRSRVLCLECESNSGPSSTVEFGAKEDCISSSTLVGRDDLRTPHLVTHLLLKTRDVLFPMDYPSIKSRAQNCSTLAARLYKPVASTEAIDLGPSVSEVQTVQTTTATFTVELKMPSTGTNDSDPSPQLAPTTTTSGGDNSTGPEEGLKPNDEKPANVEYSADGPKSDSKTGAPTEIDNNSPSAPPAAPSITGGAGGTIEEDSHSDPGTPSEPSDLGENEGGETITLNCLICHERVSAPCWYCIDCKHLDAFVCRDYQNRYRKEALAADSSAHHVLHMLIRFGNTEGKPALEAPTTLDSSQDAVPERDLDRRLREVEQRLILRMDEDKRELQEQVGAVEQRLARIEALLQALLPLAATSIPDRPALFNLL